MGQILKYVLIKILLLNCLHTQPIATVVIMSTVL